MTIRASARVAPWLVASVLLLAWACTDTALTAPRQITGASQQITIALGDNADIVLQNIGPGSFAEPQITSSAVEYMGVCPVDEQPPAGLRQCFRLHAQLVGSALVLFKHTQMSQLANQPDVIDTITVE